MTKNHLFDHATLLRMADKVEELAHNIRAGAALLQAFEAVPNLATLINGAPEPTPAPAESPEPIPDKTVQDVRVILNLRPMRKGQLRRALFGDGAVTRKQLVLLDDLLAEGLAQGLFQRDGQQFRACAAPPRPKPTATAPVDTVGEARALEARILEVLNSFDRAVRRAELKIKLGIDKSSENRFNKAIQRLAKRKEIASPRHGYWQASKAKSPQDRGVRVRPSA